MNKLVSGAIGVELFLSASGKVYFPDIIDLRHKRIKHIDFCPVTSLPNAPSGNQISALMNTMSLTIMESNTQKELIQSLPLANLTLSNRLFINKIIDFQRSYITLTGAGNQTGNSLYFVFWYDEPSVWNVVNQNTRSIIEPFEIQLTSHKTYFKEHLAIRNKQIENILLTFPVYSPTGNQGITSDFHSNKFMTLVKNNFEYFRQVPIYFFNQVNAEYPIRLQNITIDFEKSYIETLGITEDDLQSICFNAIIDDNNSAH